MTLHRAAHTAFRTGLDAEAWRRYARATIAGRPELGAARDKALAIIARNGLTRPPSNEGIRG